MFELAVRLSQLMNRASRPIFVIRLYCTVNRWM